MSHTRLITLLCAALATAIVASLHIGLQLYSPATVLRALTGADTGTDALIITTLRVPRTLIAVVCGGLLGLSGLLMQAASRNPLAEPGLLGVNSGAALAVVLLLTVGGVSSLAAISVAAFCGAILTAMLVFSLAGLAGRGMMPVTVLLAGVTLAAIFSAIVQVLLLTDEAALETLLFWLSGGFADRDAILAAFGMPVLAVAIVVTIMLSPALDAMRADDQSAAAIGVQVRLTRSTALALAGLCAGAAVALAGPVAFLGLVAPHLARRLPGAGRDHRRLLLVTVLTGAVIAVLADILARLVVAPGEAPVGTVLALVGVPVLIGLLRRNAEAVA